MEKNDEKNTTKEKSKSKVIIITFIVLAIIFVVACFGSYYFFRGNNLGNIVDDGAQEQNILETAENIISNETNLLETNNVTSEEENTANTNTAKNTNTTNTTNTSSNTSKATSTTKNTNTANTTSNNSKNTNTTTNNSKNTNTTTNNNKNTNTTSNNNKNTNTNNNKNSNTAKVTKTGTDESKELTKSETKYGVKINTYTIKRYDVYSDGSKKETSSYTTTEYDRTGYKASTSELLPEARSLKSSNSSSINDVLKYVNQYRKEANEKQIDGVTDRKDLTLDSNLTVAACARAVEIAYAKKFSHTRPDGRTCFTILDDMNIGYNASGENISSGRSTAKAVSEGWKNSSGHYANMINKNYGKIGIGVIKLRGTYYWVQLFTN